jgi:DNA mismatch endonuclease (patch repair protein)
MEAIIMADVHSKEVRSYNMSRIKGKDTKPEILVRKYLFSQGLRYRLYSKKLPGKPDIVLAKYKTAIFINGCFWHGHEGCHYFVIPKTRADFWTKKINTNIQNDKIISRMLENMGWQVIIIWECELKKEKREKTLCMLLNNIKNLSR